MTTEDVIKNNEENRAYATNAFLQKVYEDARAKMNVLNCPEDQLEQYKADLKEKLEQTLRLSQLDNLYGTQMTYEKVLEFTQFDLTIEKYTLNAIDSLPFPVYIIRPQKENGAQVLYCHGHDDLGVMGALLERHDKIRYHKNLPILLAKEGFTVVAPEFAGFADCDYYGFPEGKQPKGGCFAHMAFLTMAGYSIGGLRVLQAQKTLDMMQQMGLDKKILGFGVSGGGMVCEYLGVLDERIEAMCISCYASLYRNSILYKEHCVDNFISGMLQVGESHEILATFAPRPLMTINGIWDRAFPVAGTNIAFPYLEEAYKKQGGEYTGVTFEGKHEINAEEVLKWMSAQIS